MGARSPRGGLPRRLSGIDGMITHPHAASARVQTMIQLLLDHAREIDSGPQGKVVLHYGGRVSIEVSALHAPVKPGPGPQETPKRQPRELI